LPLASPSACGAVWTPLAPRCYRATSFLEVTVLGMGCCLVAGVAAASPRIILFGMWLFTDYIGRAYETWIWPFLGFLLLPTTTIAYSIAANEFGGFRGWGAVVVAAGVVIDVLIYSGGKRSRG
jgi:hypothetical protein